MNKKRTPEILKKLRKRLALSQSALAKELHVSFPTVNRWENGKTTPPPAMFNAIRQFVLSHRNECADIIADFFSDAETNAPGALDEVSFDEAPRFRRPSATLEMDNAGPSDDEIISVRRPGPALDTKTMEGLLWQAACSIRGEKDAPKFKDYILPLIFIKRLSDVFEDEISRLIKTDRKSVV